MEHLWEDEAANWVAWTRSSKADAYRDYSPAFFALVPGPGRATLEVGCGEGACAGTSRLGVTGSS